MPNFIVDNTSLAPAKSVFYSNPVVPADQKCSAGDWNELRQAVIDIRSCWRGSVLADLSAANLTVTGALSATGAISTSGAITGGTITGTAFVTSGGISAGGSLSASNGTFTGNVSVTGTLSVGGNTTLGDAITDTTTVNGSISITGGISTNGSNTLGNSTDDATTVNGTVNVIAGVSTGVSASPAGTALTLEQVNGTALYLMMRGNTSKFLGFANGSTALDGGLSYDSAAARTLGLIAGNGTWLTMDATGNIVGQGDNTYFSWDAGSGARIGFAKKSGTVGKLAYGSAVSFAISQSSGTSISTGNTFTDRLVVDSSGNTTIGDASSSRAHVLNGNLTFQNNPNAGPIKVGAVQARVLLARQVVSATNHSLAATTGTRAVKLVMVGGGGGGGGAAGGANQAAAGGGGSGLYWEKWIDVSTPLSTYDVTIGAAGTAGSAGNNPGGTGGDTSVVVNGATYTTKGGTGGAGMATTTLNAALGGAPGTGATAADVTAGDRGRYGFVVGGGAFPGDGGSGRLGVAGVGGSSPSAGTGWGAGGGGAGAAGSSVAGAAGSGGVAIIEEYA